MGADFEINFDNPLATYFCGDTVTGHVLVKLKKPKRMKAIEVRFFGASEVKWTETYSHRQGNRTVTRTLLYYSQEVYIDSTACLLGGTGTDVTLPPGEFKYNFALILPQALPSSFEGEIGRVRYTVKAKMIRPWRFDHECKVAYTVLNILDLNSVLNVQDPFTAMVEKSLCCGCCRSGPISIGASLPFTAFVPGQTVQALIEVDNQSSTEVSVKSRLIQKITYTGACGAIMKSMEARCVVEEEKIGVTEKRGSKNFRMKMRVPAVPSSFLLFCNCIEIAYILEIEGVIPGLHTNALMEIPVVIGVVPLRTQFNSLLPSAPDMPSTSAAPNMPHPAPPPGFNYPDLPPPSYEESVTGKANIRGDDDNKHTQGSAEYAPRYPMYRFQ